MSETVLGRVVRGDAKAYQVEIDGEIRTFVPRGKLFEERDREVKNPIAVGDRVRVSLDRIDPTERKLQFSIVEPARKKGKRVKPRR